MKGFTQASMFGGIRVYSDENCRSTKEFRDELVSRRRTWRERFVDGPVWAPKSEFAPPEMMKMGIPVAYELVGQGAIVAHPELVEQFRKAARR